MILYRDLLAFTVSDCVSIKHALGKIEKNKHKIVYVVDDKNHLLGALADGDFRRWCIEQSEVDLSASVAGVFNKNCYSLLYDNPSHVIERELRETNRSIPLVDADGHLVAVADKGARFFEIDGRRISREDPAYIIAEIGNNHQGDIHLAKRLVRLAAESNVDCIKFQMRSMGSLYGDAATKDKASQDLGAQYTLDLLSKFQLSDEELYEVFDYCKNLDVTPLCTPWDLDSLSKLEGYGLAAYKVASADFTNFELLDAIASTGKVMLCSTGMSTEDEIRETVQFLESRKAQYILLHCNSTYPTPYKDVELNYLQRLEELSGGIVGYSGHERGGCVPVAAIALGARVIEKHFTIDKTLEGNDHKVSLLPDELTEMVKSIRAVEESMGSGSARSLTQGELMNREVLAKSLHINCHVAKGEVITKGMLDVRCPGHGLQPNKAGKLVGAQAVRDLEPGDCLFESDITGSLEKKNRYEFRRPYGIPVRYHDYRSLIGGMEIDFVEFHLSYGDMKLELSEYLERDESLGFAVHAPELFENDHLLDIASYDKDYRCQSIAEMERVISQACELKTYFPSTKKPVIVVNAGGWDQSGFLAEADVKEKYALIKQGLELLDTSGVQVAIQTMPPFPWHFGGQSFHNLFVDADEIVAFCEETEAKICLDVSHSMMACNYYKTDFYEFVEKVAPYVVHMHVVDALGIDGEGVQIGCGDVDFSRLGEILDKHAPGVQFIPEVWQGHKNRGEGFWQALNYLEKKFK